MEFRSIGVKVNCRQWLLTGLLALSFSVSLLPAFAQQTPNITDSVAQQKVNPLDSVELSLLTCSPHEEIYSLYGHTAIRYHDLRTGEDMAFNWGIFNFKAPYFALRFVFGLTDYELGLMSFDRFCEYYRKWGSSVTEQVLNLTPDEKRSLINAMMVNYQPENRTYRYNFFFDNCATRPRDMIERNIDGKVMYAAREDYKPTFREMIRQCTAHHEWATCGNDLLLGVRADMKTTREEQEFLPQNLMYDFDHAQIRATDGSIRPLLKDRRMAVSPGVQMREKDFPLTPTECACILLVICLIFALMEWRRKKTYKYWDALLMTLQGLAGCVLTVMVFSQHPATSLNLQILLLNPLPLFFLPQVLRRKKTRWWGVLFIMALLFFAGGFLQHYAEGMYILALSLLLRVIINVKLQTSKLKVEK